MINIKRLKQRLKKRQLNETNIWVFGEWFGKRCCDNSLFFANYVNSLCNNSICVVWIYKEKNELWRLNNGIIKVEMNSKDANDYLSKARFIFLNQNINDVTDDNSKLFRNSIIINFWHGVPWKKIGLDSISKKNPLKRFYVRMISYLYKPDYFLVTSDYYMPIIMRTYSLKRNNILLSGHPRNSLFYNNEEIQKCKLSFINRLSFIPNIVITYMPTFRDNTSNNFSFDSLLKNDKFVNLLEKFNVVIIQKKHFVDENRLIEEEKIFSSRIINDVELSATELLSISDILITDYSSCFFDYLVLNRPIIHFLFDYDTYSNMDRGLYFRIEDVACGKVCYNEDKLIESIEAYLNDKNIDEQLRIKRKNQFMQYDTENTNNNIFRFLMNNN